MNSSFEGFHPASKQGQRDHSNEVQPRAPITLNPVQPPMRRDLINTSIEMSQAANDYLNNGGYSSPGVETDTSIPNRIGKQKLGLARGPIKAQTNRESQVSTALSKITKV